MVGATVAGSPPAAWAALEKTLEKLPRKPQLSIRRFPPPNEVRNLALTEIKFARDVIGVEKDLTLASKVDMRRTWGDCYAYAMIATGRAEVSIAASGSANSR